MDPLLLRMKFRVRIERGLWRGSIISPWLWVDSSPDKRKPGVSVKQAQDRFTLLG